VEEEDVLEEISRIKTSKLDMLCKQEPLIVNNLIKTYSKNNISINAVNNLSFGVTSQQCFGLLVIFF
jgi:hypothetical protein